MLFPIGVCCYEKSDEIDFLFAYLEDLVREVGWPITVLHVHIVLFFVFVMIVELYDVVMVTAELVDFDLILGVLLQLWTH